MKINLDGNKLQQIMDVILPDDNKDDDKIFDDGIICSKEDEKEFDDYVNYLISDGKWYIGAEGINQLMTDANTISPN